MSLLSLLPIALAASLTTNNSADALIGHWLFTKMIYQGQELPPRDPNLLLTFDFSNDGKSRLYWTFDEGKTFCERTGHYEFDGTIIKDRVEWVNPANESKCAQDPDMQTARETLTPAEASADSLSLHLPFGDDDLTYVFSRD